MADQHARDEEMTDTASEEATDELTDDQVDDVSGGLTSDALNAHMIQGSAGFTYGSAGGNGGNGGDAGLLGQGSRRR